MKNADALKRKIAETIRDEAADYLLNHPECGDITIVIDDTTYELVPCLELRELVITAYENDPDGDDQDHAGRYRVDFKITKID